MISSTNDDELPSDDAVIEGMKAAHHKMMASERKILPRVIAPHRAIIWR